MTLPKIERIITRQFVKKNTSVKGVISYQKIQTMRILKQLNNQKAKLKESYRQQSRNRRFQGILIYFQTLISEIFLFPQYLQKIHRMIAAKDKNKKNKTKYIPQEILELQQQVKSMKIMEDLQILSHTLNTISKLSLLKDKNIRFLIVQLLKTGKIKEFSASYFEGLKNNQFLQIVINDIGCLSTIKCIKIVKKINVLKKIYSTQDDQYFQSQADQVKNTVNQLIQCPPKQSIEQKLKIIVSKKQKIEIISSIICLLKRGFRLQKQVNRQSLNKDKVRVVNVSSSTVPDNNIIGLDDPDIQDLLGSNQDRQISFIQYSYFEEQQYFWNNQQSPFNFY